LKAGNLEVFLLWGLLLGGSVGMLEAQLTAPF